MLQLIEANWIVFALALLIGLLVAWWIFARSSSNGRASERRPDVLDEGVAPAQRNQALIDAPPAAAGTMAGIAEIVAAGYASADVERVTRLIKINEYKRRQSPVGIRITHRAFGRDWRYPITSKFRA